MQILLKTDKVFTVTIIPLFSHQIIKIYNIQIRVFAVQLNHEHIYIVKYYTKLLVSETDDVANLLWAVHVS